MSSPQKPPDTPEAIAARYADAAKKAVRATAQVAIDAYDKVENKPPSSYSPGDAAASLSQLAGATLAGAFSLARVALQVQWDRRLLLVADNVAAIVATGVNDAVNAAGATAQKAAATRLTRQDLVDSAVMLTSIGALRSAEILETVVGGPGPYLDPVLQRTFGIASSDQDATLAVTSMIRTSDDRDIKAMVGFDPPSCVLPKEQTTFTLVINISGLPSGMYRGTITATQVDDPTKVRSVDVTFALPETSDPPEL